jgi:quercetin dioxygenase-like cupin family protein
MDMRKSVFQIITVVVPLLLILSGCSTVRTPSETGASAIVNTVLDKDTHSWDGNLLPMYPKGQPEVTVLRISIPPKATLRTHRHPVINAAVLISGRLTVKTLDGQTLYLKGGDSLIEVVNTWHYGVNTGKIPADIIVFYAGVAGSPITLFQHQLAADEGTGDGGEPKKVSVETK